VQQTSHQKVKTMFVQMIAQSKLIPSPRNVRKTRNKDLVGLTAHIKAKDILQNLVVTNELNKLGQPTGRYFVEAGERRRRVLAALVKAKHFMKDHPVPCRVIDDVDAVDASSAENILREAMHPADEFEAFRDMVDAGRPVEDVAALFGVTPALVIRRLKLAALSPRLLTEYREDRATLEQMMALTLSDGHDIQEAAWFEAPVYSRQPHSLRARIIADEQTSDSPLARFVGLDSYEVQGGRIRRDLFGDEGGYLMDGALLQKLAEDKLVEAAEVIRVNEGWGWAEGRISFSYSDKAAFQQCYRRPKTLTEAEQVEVDRLTLAYDDVCDNADDEEANAEAEALSEQIDAISQADFSVAEYALGGVVVSIDHAGQAIYQRGLLREDAAKALAVATKGDGGEAGSSVVVLKSKAALSAPLMLDLTAKRTLALAAALLDHPTVALASMVHNLIVPLFFNQHWCESPVQIGFKANRTDAMRSAVDGPDTLAAQVIETEERSLRAVLPEAKEDLWSWLLDQDQMVLMRLLTFAISKTLDAVQQAHETAGRGRLAAADQLASAIDLNMADWWNSTAEDYFARVSKPAILSAVTEGASAQAAENIARMKKPEMASAAERLLDGKGWLPAPLRAVGVKAVAAVPYPMAAE
jgi:ParB family chromosome partitioning protein